MTDKPKTIQEALMKVRENAQLIDEQTPLDTIKQRRQDLKKQQQDAIKKEQNIAQRLNAGTIDQKTAEQEMNQIGT